MVNLYYDLPLDVREIIDKKKKEMELRDALLNELKAFDRVAWSRQRFKEGKFPYDVLNNAINPDAIDVVGCILEFYECEGEFDNDYCDGVYEESMNYIFEAHTA